ncbi:hypothetical protein [Caballeronia fortuita]|uniref:hypothetical protein n=1 Tax=Caballeronia fortuita TaxID=1777138 RepID=UPI000ACBAD0B|nr:hypothetical protein [Caballeronia fortuita]
MSDLPLDIQAFIVEQERSREERYRQASFLKSEYENPVWTCDFGTKGTFEIDWRVKLSDGSILTERKRLWDSLRMFLCVQTNPDASRKSFEKSDARSYYLVRQAMDVVDYLLLNDASLCLHSYGLNALTVSDMQRMLEAFAKSSSIRSVVDWSSRLEKTLYDGIATLTWDDICGAMSHSRKIAEVHVPDEDRELHFDEREIVFSRIWLWRERANSSGSSRWPYRVKPSSRFLCSRIFDGTIGLCKAKFSLPEELCWAPKESYVTEYPRASVQAERFDIENGRSLTTMEDFLRVVRRLRMISVKGNKVPQAALKALKDARAAKLISSPRIGHFIIPAAQHVKFALDKAVRFFKEHVPHILESYAAVVSASYAAGMPCYKFATSSNVLKHIDDRTRLLGVRVWHLAFDTSGTGRLRDREKVRPSASIFFDALRNNEGLVELTKIAFGACLFIVGALTGRRQGELEDLISGKCIDPKMHRMTFENRKSGASGVRQSLTRPIPPLVTEVINCIQSFHKKMQLIGSFGENVKIFSSPTRFGNCVISQVAMGVLLDRFMDYIELPANNEGTRSYIRLHQLRRFFVSDYYRRRGGTLGTLSWYLGHSDPRQVDAYLDIDYGPYELERSQAHVAVESLQMYDNSPYERLRDLIEEKFGTRAAVIDEADAVEAFLISKRHDSKFRIINDVLEFKGVGTLRAHLILEGKSG